MSDLVKLALNPAVVAGMTRSLKGLGAGAGMGGAVGGIAGGAIGAVRGVQKAHDEGTSAIGGALGGALGGAWRGAGKGALLGAAVGGVAGAARPAYAEALSAHLPGSHFGQRQVHALTGVGDKDPGYLRSIGGGAADAEHRLQQAVAARQASGSAKDVAEYQQARKGFVASQASERKGLYSIPGYAKSLARDPVGTLRTGVKDQWENLGTGGRALMYGLPAAGVVKELETKDSDDGQGRLERAGRLLGAAGSGMVAPLAIGGDIALGGALTSGLGRLGHAGDRALARRRPPPPAAPPMDPGGGSTQAESREFSDRAAGVSPEGFNQ